MNVTECKPISIQDKRRIGKHKDRLEKQRKKKIKALKTNALQKHSVGSLYWVKTRTGLAPYNSKGQGTSYLVSRGTTCLAERILSGYRLWLTGGRPYNTMADIRKNCPFYIARFTEITFLNTEVKIK